VRRIGDAEDAIRQYERGDIRLDQLIDVEVGSWSDASESIEFSRELTTVGRIIFNQALPERLRFVNKIVRRADLKALIGVSVEKLGIAESARLADSLKDLGFKYSTSAGMSIAISDIPLSSAKKDAVQTSDKKVLALREQFEDGLITDEERYRNTVDIWKRTTQAVNDDMTKSIDPESTLFMMMDSGARGNKGQMGQLGGMRGLVADPSGKIMELPITASLVWWYSIRPVPTPMRSMLLPSRLPTPLWPMLLPLRLPMRLLLMQPPLLQPTPPQMRLTPTSLLSKPKSKP
jgi:DNA-directed RNA polymerase subunit beta'